MWPRRYSMMPAACNCNAAFAIPAHAGNTSPIPVNYTTSRGIDLSRAIGYDYTAVKVMQHNGQSLIVPYTEHIPPDVGAATLWLTNRRGGQWRSNQSHEVTGKDGAFVAGVAIATADPVEAARVYQQMIRGGEQTTPGTIWSAIARRRIRPAAGERTSAGTGGAYPVAGAGSIYTGHQGWVS